MSWEQEADTNKKKLQKFIHSERITMHISHLKQFKIIEKMYLLKHTAIEINNIILWYVTMIVSLLKNIVSKKLKKKKLL